MATKAEIIEGLNYTVSQAKRTSAFFEGDEWETKRPGGWTPKEIYSHVAVTAATIPQAGQMLLTAPEGSDVSAGMDINAMNAAGVASLEAMTPAQVLQTLEANYAKWIDWVNGLPDDVLNQKRSFLMYTVPVSDILSNLALHGLHHIYEAHLRVPL